MYRHPYSLQSIMDLIESFMSTHHLTRDTLAFTCILFTALFALFLFCVAHIYRQAERDFPLNRGLVDSLPETKQQKAADNPYQHMEYRSDFM